MLMIQHWEAFKLAQQINRDFSFITRHTVTGCAVRWTWCEKLLTYIGSEAY